MTLDDVKERVGKIRAFAGDPEAAHCEEDDLYRDILIAVRDGKIVDAVRCCEEALKSQDLDFPRWGA